MTSVTYHNLKPDREDRPRRKTPKEKRPGQHPEYLEKIRQLPCCVCGEPPRSDPHHLQSTGQRGMALRSTDDNTVPLCRMHHDALHARPSTKERDWFASYGIKPLTLAAALWASRHDLDAMVKVLEAHRG